MMILSSEKLSKYLKQLRDERKLSVEDLSCITGLDSLVINHIENNGFIPNIHQFEALVKTLNLKPDDLICNKYNSSLFGDLLSEANIPSEKEGLNKLFAMMVALRQQFNLRNSFENSSFK